MPAIEMPVGSAERPLRIRRRRDLEACAQPLGNDTVWAIKDPVALRYFHIRDEAHWVLEQLDGHSSPAEIQARYAARFAPRRLGLAHLRALLTRFHDDGLVVVDSPGQADFLQSRARKLRSRQRRERWANPLAIRFRGVDPDGFLNALYPWCRWMFSRTFLAGCLLMTVATALLVATRFETLLARLPERETFLSPANLAWLGLTLAGVKILHELGHALACKHFGRECHELGLMFLVFTPCLYCNVTDAWMLPRKSQRAAVGAAGIFVELALAATCTFLWWFSQPGLFNSLCLNTMFVCSASTLLLNGNPLLRYDGYFVLSDLIEMPNLASESSGVVRRALARWCLGIDDPQDEPVSVGRQIGLAVYAVASLAYRVVVLAGILWFIYKTLEPLGLAAFAHLLVAAVVVGWVMGPVRQVVKLWNDEWWSEHVQPRRAVISAVLLLTLAAGALMIPLPHRIRAPLVLQPAGARRVYAVVPGTLVRSVRVGDAVRAGDELATISNSDLELAIQQLRGERNRQRLRVETLKLSQGSDPQSAAQLPSALELLADLEERLSRRLMEEERLTLTAPVGGTVLPARQRPAEQSTGRLATWRGTPLDPQNEGSFLETGTLVCLIGDATALEAILAIDQADIEFIAVGRPVQIQLDQQPAGRLRGRIVELAEIDLDVTPAELLPQGEVPTRRDEQGRLRPAGTFYQARVALEPQAQTLLAGETGRAKVDAAPLSLGTRLWRAVRRTFGFDLALP